MIKSRGMDDKTKNQVKKTIKGLKKASVSHAKQAKTLEAIKLKKVGL
jgi:hypothetical protein